MIGWYAGRAEKFVGADCHARKYLGVPPVFDRRRVDHFHHGLESCLDLSGFLDGINSNRGFHPRRLAGRRNEARRGPHLPASVPERVGNLLVSACTSISLI